MINNNPNAIELPVTGGNTIDGVYICARNADLTIEGATGDVISHYRSNDGTNWTKVGDWTMSDDIVTKPMVRMTPKGYTKIVSSGTITSAVILWGDI